MVDHTKKGSSAVDFNPFRDLGKTFEQFKMPGVDMAAFVDARRKDVDALVAANRITYEALQALAQTQTDMLTQAMQSVQESAKVMQTPGEKGGAANIAKHTEAAQKAWQKMLDDMKALAEMAQKAQTDAMAGLTERAQQNMSAVKDLTHAK